MSTALIIAQIILAILITGAILLQAQGTGIGQAWGGGGETFHTRRGLEKVLFYSTMVMIALFIATSLGNIIIN